ncbi:unnamed protein product, partial [Dibothriocephalus latus]
MAFMAVKETQHGLFLNQGQCCCSGTRIYVEEPIYNEFLERSAAAAKARVVGDPFDPKTDQ